LMASLKPFINLFPLQQISLVSDPFIGYLSVNTTGAYGLRPHIDY